jgi:succinoglycan biosynthesis transport protein ExoP
MPALQSNTFTPFEVDMSIKPFSEANAISLTDRFRELDHPAPAGEPYEAEQVLSFDHYFWLLRRNWPKIAIAVAVCTAIAVVACLLLKPEYEATARIAIDLKTPSKVIGEQGTQTSAGDADELFNTELQLIQTDGVLRPVAEQFHLLAAKTVNKLPDGIDPADAPVSLKGLSVVHPANSLLIDITYRSSSPKTAAEIANAVARSYIARGMELRVRSSQDQSAFMEKQIDELKKKMDLSETALAGYEKRLGVVNPEEKTSILTARLLQLNTQYTDAENDRIRKEADYNALKTGSLAAIEVSPQAAALAKLEEQVHTAQEKMAIAKTVYGPNYAEYKRAANELDEVTRQYTAMQHEVGNRIVVEYNESRNRQAMIQAALTSAKAESDSLNASSLQYQQLKREAEANKTLYDELYRKVKEASINGGFQSNAIRIVDEARPQLHPVFPNKPAIVLLAMLFSFAISVVALIVSDLLDKTLRDPAQARRAVGAEVIGILPSVSKFNMLPTLADQAPLGSVALSKPPANWFSTSDFYREAIATLLSTIFLERRSYPLRSILVTSAAPGEGKSSCAAYMAAAHARKGFRTLLIDADLRRPSQRRFFDVEGDAGLAEAIVDHRALSEVRQPVKGNDKLDIVVAGNGANHMLDQVGLKIEQFLVQARKEYDVVFIDAPPMLCFAEPLQIACVVDGVLVVSLAGETSQQAVSGVLSVLRRLRANTLGLVLNQVKHGMSPSYQPYQSYYRHIDRPTLKSA